MLRVIITLESHPFEWTYDTTSPTITITSAEGLSGFTSNDASISLTFTLSESTSDFTSAYVTVIGGGTLSSFTQGSGTDVYCDSYAFHRRASID